MSVNVIGEIKVILDNHNKSLMIINQSLDNLKLSLDNLHERIEKLEDK